MSFYVLVNRRNDRSDTTISTFLYCSPARTLSQLSKQYVTGSACVRERVTAPDHHDNQVTLMVR